MESRRNFLVLTNNPLVPACLPPELACEIRTVSARQILIEVRDLVYSGHRLYTHPLAGSVKPNENPYRSVVVSRRPGKMEPEEAGIISDSIAVFDKFPPCPRDLPEQVKRDFQLIDYSLLCSGLGLDAQQGLSNRKI